VGEEPKRVRITGGRDDLERVASMAAEKTAAMISKGLLEEVRRIRERLERLEAEVSAIKAILERMESSRGRGPSLRDRVKAELEETGYILLSEAARRLRASPQAIIEAGASLGATVITTGSDAILITRRALEELKAAMRNVKSSDPREAIEAMGKYARVFEALSKAGMVYYDSKLKSWVIVE